MRESTPVNRSLDRKSTIVGLELIDIFAIVSLCSLLNLVFGHTAFKLYLVFLPTVVTAAFLIVGKRGKPEGFLLHFLRFHFQPRHLSCFFDDSKEFPFSKALYDKRHEKCRGGAN